MELLLFSGDKTMSSKKVERALTSSIVCPLSLSCLQLVSLQAANATPRIKHVYTTLMTLKLFHYSPERAESLKEIQKVLYLPEHKIVKPSNTRWLAH